MDNKENISATRESVCSLSFPLQPAYMQAALDFAHTLARELGFESREQNHIRLALEETFLFISRSASAGNAVLPVDVVFERQPDGILIRVTHKGMPIDLDQLPEFSPDAIEADGLDVGLSLHLARCAADSVAFKNRGRAGMDIEILKRNPALHVSRLMPAGGLAEPARETADEGKCSIRPALAADALAISQCAYLAYGRTYEDYIYYPERIREMNATGELCSLVAVNAKGVVVGHCALKFSHDRAARAELGVLFVKPEYRRHGLGATLWGAAVDLGRNLGVATIFARSVTGHRASQAMAEAHGFHDFALLLALFPPAVELKSLGGVQPGKMSGVLQTLNLEGKNARRIFPPADHVDIICELYRRAGMPVKIHPSPAAASDAEPDAPKLHAMRVDCFNIAVMKAACAGASAEKTARWCVGMNRKLCGEKVDATYLYINLGEPAAAPIAEECARAGFVFAGIAPGEFDQSDALILQYVNQAADPFEQLTAGTETAMLLRDYIRAEWGRLAN